MTSKRKLGRARNKKNTQEDIPKKNFITMLERQFDMQMEDLAQKRLAILDKINKAYLMQLATIPEHLKNTKLKDIVDDPCQLKVQRQREEFSKGSNVRPGEKSFLQSFDKPGYYTICGNIDRKDKTPNIFKTPVSVFASHQNGITPKVNPGILRIPQQDEMAVSSSGSPLLVSTSVRHDTVNINVPLKDGKKILIMPNPDIDTSGIRDNLDHSVKQQLQQLMTTLNKLMD